MNIRVFFLYIIILLFSGCDMLHPKPQATSYYLVVPARSIDKNDVKWASYLKNHLDNRSSLSGAVLDRPKNNLRQLLKISVSLDADMSNDYAIDYSSRGVVLKARDENKLLWLIYQFISMLGDKDKHFDVSDLPTPVLSYGKSAASDFAFDYRCIYSHYNNSAESFPIVGASHIDYDWGIWGHNLAKVLSKKTNDIYAHTKSGIDKEQFCFSSPELYNEVVDYISNNFGDKTTARFCIMPNDNPVVCQCARCRKTGNTSRDATPAVTAFIERLARRFPNHIFVTSQYLSTSSVPNHRLPKNIGVIISAINLPLQANLVDTREANDFAQVIKAWRKCCSMVYVWDYNRNYDDYLSPFPCLKIIQQRLQFYKQNGVTGVIFNDSGDDYASFDDMQTSVLAQLLVNPYIDVKECWHRYFKRFYPETSDILIQYYDSIENRAFASAQPLEIYGGMNDAVKEYLVPQEFEAFYQKLEKKSKMVSDNERTRLNKLLTALNFTRLELLRLNGSVDKDLVRQSLANLEGSKEFSDMCNYRETRGSIDDYICFINEHEFALPSTNPLQNKLSVLSQVDDAQTSSYLLTDGRLGAPFDYHMHWLVYSGDTLRISISSLCGKELQMNFMEATPWHIFLPQSVMVYQMGEKVFESSPIDDSSYDFTLHTVSIPLGNIRRDVPIELIIIKSGHSFAIDEIVMR